MAAVSSAWSAVNAARPEKIRRERPERIGADRDRV
ncbi:hypothetical protein ACVIHC_003070 [Bradyrhizobium diazoefficiens]